MPIAASRPEILRGRVFRGTWAVRTGLLTPDQLRSSAWRRLRRDVHCDADLEDTHHLHLRAVSLVMPRESAFAGRSAAVLWRVREAAGAGDAVEVVVAPGTRWTPGPGVAVRTAPLTGDVVADRRGLRRTTVVRTALDLARFLPLDDAVAHLDQLLRITRTDVEGVRAAARQLGRCRGSARARAAAALVDGRAESPQETRLRLLIVRAGLPLPIAQHEIWHDRRLVARVDFAWPALRLALEYDGLHHAGREQLGPDRARLNGMTGAGWRFLFVTARDMWHPERIVTRLESALCG